MQKPIDIYISWCIIELRDGANKIKNLKGEAKMTITNEMIQKEVETLKAQNWGVGFITPMTIEEAAKMRIEDRIKREKEEAEKAQSGIVKMHYSEYKNNYSGYKTVPGSYDKKEKTIEVITKSSKAYSNNKPCPRCGTYCYGDCRA